MESSLRVLCGGRHSGEQHRAARRREWRVPDSVTPAAEEEGGARVRRAAECGAERGARGRERGHVW